MEAHSVSHTSSSARDRLWPLSDPATIAVAVMAALFLAYALGWFVGYADGQAVR